MNRKELQDLQAMRDYPSLSVLAPTHRTAPDNAGDPIRVKNLVTDVTNQLLEKFPRRDVEPILERLDFLVEEIDWRYTLDAVALFVNKDFAARFDLPFPVQQRVAIDDGFATRDLVFAMNRSPRYWVLVLSEQPTRLFEAVRDNLQESNIGAFPIEHSGPGGASAMPGGFGVQQSAYRDEYDRKFFRKVDEELTRVLEGEPLPVLVVGVVRNLAFWDELSANKSHIAGSLEGSHDSTSPHELGQLVWPIMQEKMASKRAQVLDNLGDAVGAQKYASGIGEAWQMAQQGRGDTLIVEEDYHYPANLHPSGLLLPAEQDAEGAEALSDAVDDLIECVLDKGGRVVFVDNGSLEIHNRIAMILRW